MIILHNISFEESTAARVSIKFCVIIWMTYILFGVDFSGPDIKENQMSLPIVITMILAPPLKNLNRVVLKVTS